MARSPGSVDPPVRDVLALASLFAALPAAAEEQSLRPLCASRPGLGTPPCVLDKGHFQVEIGIVSVQRDDTDAFGVDTVALSSTEFSYGLDGINQVSLVVAPFNIITITDQASGASRRIMGVGDVALRWRHSLRHPDGEGVSIAVEGLVNFAIGGPEIRSNGWGAGLLVPVSIPITGTLAFIAAPGFVWSENRNTAGQHFDYTGSFGLTQQLGDFAVTLEGGYTRDGEPDSGRESATVSASLAWSPPRNANLQFDAGVSVAANNPAPDLQAYVGVVKRF
jgi:hypothetical protein